MSEESTEMLVQPALGPGDDDPRSPASDAAGDAMGPLAPGDDDPGSPVVTVQTSAPQPVVEEDEFDMLAPAPPGPGDAQTGPRHVTRFPRRTQQDPPPPAANTHAQEQE